MRKNKAMLFHLKQLEKSRSEGSIYLKYPEISWIIFPDFVKWDGCVLLRQEEKLRLPKKFEPNQFCPDRTCYEANVNHVHLDDYIDEVKNCPYEGLRIGLKILDIWKLKLKSQFPIKKFILILTFDGNDCVLRFHTYRDDTLPWIDASSLNDYKEGVLLLEI